MARPLTGKRVLVTRPRHQAEGFCEALRGLGAEVLHLPAAEVLPPRDFGELDAALGSLDRFDWVVLTSVNGVAAVAERMRALGIPTSRLSERRLAVIGPATGRALAEVCRAPDAMPEEHRSSAIAGAVGDVRELRFLLLRADLASGELAEALEAAGAEVTQVDAYRLVLGGGDAAVDEDPAPDYLTVTSAGIARGLVTALRDRGLGQWLERARWACIGPVTAEEVVRLGYRPHVVASTYTIEGLLEALAADAEGAAIA